ncbi:hypothetical protein BJ546DRAFT_217980 [Cryomyces antarcticus]
MHQIAQTRPDLPYSFIPIVVALLRHLISCIPSQRITPHPPSAPNSHHITVHMPPLRLLQHPLQSPHDALPRRAPNDNLDITLRPRPPQQKRVVLPLTLLPLAPAPAPAPTPTSPFHFPFQPPLLGERDSGQLRGRGESRSRSRSARRRDSNNELDMIVGGAILVGAGADDGAVCEDLGASRSSDGATPHEGEAGIWNGQMDSHAMAYGGC